MRVWAFLGLLLFACVMPFTIRSAAKKKLKEFSDRLNANRDEWDRIVKRITEEKKYDGSDRLIDKHTQLSLILNGNDAVNIIPLNHSRPERMTASQFSKIKDILGSDDTTYYSRFDSMSLYHRINDESILQIYYPSDLFIKYRYRR